MGSTPKAKFPFPPRSLILGSVSKIYMYVRTLFALPFYPLPPTSYHHHRHHRTNPLESLKHFLALALAGCRYRHHAARLSERTFSIAASPTTCGWRRRRAASISLETDALAFIVPRTRPAPEKSGVKPPPPPAPCVESSKRVADGDGFWRWRGGMGNVCASLRSQRDGRVARCASRLSSIRQYPSGLCVSSKSNFSDSPFPFGSCAATILAHKNHHHHTRQCHVVYSPT